MSGKFFAFCQEHYLLSLQGHLAHCLSSHLIFVREPHSGRIAIGSHKKQINKKIFRALAHQWDPPSPGHPVWSDSAKKDDLKTRFSADIVGNESAVGNDCEIFAGSSGAVVPGQSAPATAALDHNRIAIVDELCGACSNFAFLFIMVGDPSADIVRIAEGGKTMLAADQAPWIPPDCPDPCGQSPGKHPVFQREAPLPILFSCVSNSRILPG